MKNKLSIFFVIFLAINKLGYSQPTNDNCSSATLLTVNSVCKAGQTKSGVLAGIEAGEVTLPSCMTNNMNETVWYYFVASAAYMYVQVTSTTNLSSAQSGNWCSVVYNTIACVPSLGNIIS